MASFRTRRRIRTLSVLMGAIVVAVSVIGAPLAPSASAAPVNCGGSGGFEGYSGLQYANHFMAQYTGWCKWSHIDAAATRLVHVGTSV